MYVRIFNDLMNLDEFLGIMVQDVVLYNLGFYGNSVSTISDSYAI